MVLEKKKYTPYRLEEERAKDKTKVLSIRFSFEELKEMERDAKILQQEKLSSTVKTLILIGQECLHHDFSGKILQAVLTQLRRNKRTGIMYPQIDFTQK